MYTVYLELPAINILPSFFIYLPTYQPTYLLSPLRNMEVADFHAISFLNTLAYTS